MFKTLFRVDIQTFDFLRDIIILAHEWCNPAASDRFGHWHHHVELLLLGCLPVSGYDTTQKICESHRKFFL
jgi:hypothetical protein